MAPPRSVFGRRGRTALMVAGALVLGLAPEACRRRAPAAVVAPPKPALGPIAVDDVSPPDDNRAPLDLAAIETGLRDRLLAAELFAPAGADGGAGPVSRLRAAIGAETVEAGAKGEARVVVRLHLDSRPADAPGALAFELEGNAAVPYAVAPRASRRGAAGAAASAAPPFVPIVLRVAGDLVSGFAARRRLYDGPASVVHAALVGDAGGELREEAIRAAGERQLHDEAPALLALLADPDETTRDTALGALIVLKDRRAVTELTRTRSLRDRREMRKIIEAIAILGGQEADEYLSFVAATHDDDEIRSAAAGARARIARRQADGNPP